MSGKTARLHLGLALVSSVAAAQEPTLRFGPPFVVRADLHRPYGLAVDEGHGRLLLADTGHHRFKWTAIEALSQSPRFDEHGFVADRNAAAALTDPQAIAADAAGNAYVVNTQKGDVRLYRLSAAGYAAGTPFPTGTPRTVDGTDILLPRDIAVGPDGAVYLLDSGNRRILRADGPNDTTWSVLRADASWGNPYGLTVDGSGAVYVADTDNHRIVKIRGSQVTTIGHFGTGRGELRFPRDVAVDAHGRIFVADTVNHRIQVLTPDGRPLLELGHPPSIGTLEKVVVDTHDRIFAIDSDNDHVLAFLGADFPRPFDPFLRDFPRDDGSEPSDDFYRVSSPDILVRHQADVDLAAAASAGLESIAFQDPRFDRNNYVYVAIHNRGTQAAADSFVKLYSYDPGGAARFPADWRAGDFFLTYGDAAHNRPGNALAVPPVAPGSTVVVGPLVWRPPAPETTAGRDGALRIAARLTNPYDYPPGADVPSPARASNDVSERAVVVTRWPFPVGPQNTLVVRVHFPDVSSATDPAVVAARADEMAAWIHETSWGEAEVTVAQRGPVTLDQPRDFYTNGNTPLIEMAQEVLDKLVAAEPGVLDGPSPDQPIGRVVLVTNDTTPEREWATTGSWRYTLRGQPRDLTVSVQAAVNSANFYAHGLSHQLGMVDLYAHENVRFPRPFADEWDNMARPFNGAHPLVWSKELSRWVTSHNAQIPFVGRPRPGETWSNNGQRIHLHYQDTAAAGQVVGVAFGLTNGVTTLNEESNFIFVEARRNTRPGADRVVPGTGVLMYQVFSGTPQGHGPVILRDHVPGGDIRDAAIPIGDTERTPEGISVTVEAGTGGADYDLVVDYTAPREDFDVFINRGDPDWLSPDIWIDSQADGYDQEAGRELTDHGNQGIAGEENRVYARISNHGPADAMDVLAEFLFSEPAMAVDGVQSFKHYKSVFVNVPAGGQAVTGATGEPVTWTPRTDVDPHSCVKVVLGRLSNDSNPSNQEAQHNFDLVYSTHGSPYTEVVSPFQVSHDDPTAKPVYFRVDGVPAGWQWSVSPPKLFLEPRAIGRAVLKLQPPPDAPECTSHRVNVSGWMPRGDTLVRLGGTTVQVDLRRSQQVTVSPSRKGCQAGDQRRRDQPAACARIVTNGCTQPPQPNAEVVLRYEGPDGRPVYHRVRTDANGCYDDFLATVEGRDWEVSAELPASKCEGPAQARTTIALDLPAVDRPEEPLPFADGPLCLQRISLDLDGRVDSSRPVRSKPRACRTRAWDQVVSLRLSPTPAVPPSGLRLDGKLELSSLRHEIAGSPGRTGLQSGWFRWFGSDGEALGRVVGVTNTGTHRPPAARGDSRLTAGHWELSLDGIVVIGRQAGARLRAVVALDAARGGVDLLREGAELKGSLEGIVEFDPALSAAARDRRVQEARKEWELHPGRCGSDVPCLTRVSKAGRGRFVLDQIARERCSLSGEETRKTWNQLDVSLRGNAAAGLADGRLTVRRFLQATAGDERGRGEHGGTFEYRSADGMRIRGEMLGISQGGTHRAPSARRTESSAPPNHLEGRLSGIVISGPRKGALLEAAYVLTFTSQGRRMTAAMTVDGWLAKGCRGSRIVK